MRPGTAKNKDSRCDADSMLEDKEFVDVAVDVQTSTAEVDLLGCKTAAALRSPADCQ